WRSASQITVPLAERMAKKGIRLVAQAVDAIDAEHNRLMLTGGATLDYDDLVIATGPELAFDEVFGFGPASGYTHSVCTTAHAQQAWRAYQEFLAAPGPMVIGAAQGASCFGPAYEFALIVDTDLRRRKLRHKVPMTFVTSEPYIGHLGLGGVGDSKGLLESELRRRHIKWITNGELLEARPDSVHVVEHDDDGQAIRKLELQSRFTMLLPAFRGVDAVAKVPGLCNPRGFVLIDDQQRNPTHRNIFAVGVCVAIPPVEAAPVPTGVPKTGYMIESMVTAIVENIRNELAGRPATHKGTWNAICLADMGDGGIAFVALPQIPPRNLTWTKRGKWVHLAKVAYEKYFIRKMRTGNPEPIYEKYVLKALGIVRLQSQQ
ncbi:MAG: NAD(P)/FAD-dependent oxidoreductase, partial [Gammaproteobacteria bacterium]|nr:NAD(P)/FAD-dependent oxidoreductase [Gammaproteobacteria bacterium]